MRESVVRATAAVAVVGVMLLGGCRQAVEGIAQGGEARLQLDTYGCPQLDGTYSLATLFIRDPDLPESARTYAPSFAGTALGPAMPRIDGSIALGRFEAIAFRRTAPGQFEVRLLSNVDSLNDRLAEMRRDEPERYLELYRLQQPSGRDDFIAMHGQAAYEAQMARLAPSIDEAVVPLRIGAQIQCGKGWLELVRGKNGPVRLTLADNGALIGESTEDRTRAWSLRELGVCLTHCPEYEIDVGDHPATMYLSRLEPAPTWIGWLSGGRLHLEAPTQVVEAEKAADIAARDTRNAVFLASPEVIRRRLEAVAPPGTTIIDVVLGDGDVAIRYRAPYDSHDALLRRISPADENDPAAPEAVRRVAVGERGEQEVSFRLLPASPLVAREGGDTPPAAVPSQTLPAQTLPASPQPAFVASGNRPPGFASPIAIRRRVGALLPRECRIAEVRYAQNMALLIGSAETDDCLDAGLKRLAAAQGSGSAPPQLVRSRAADGRETFEIRLGLSPLVRE